MRKRKHLSAGANPSAPATPPADHPGYPVRHWTTWGALKRRHLEWFLPERLAFGTIAILEGRKTMGKSTVAAALAAALTAGIPFPGCKKVFDGNVIWLCSEEDPRLVTKPRLEAAGGDPDRIFCPDIDPRTDQPRRLCLPGELDTLDAMIGAHAARLVIFDPLSSSIGAGINLCDEQAVRGVLEPLAAVAGRRECLMLLIRHLRKSSIGPALDQGLGSAGMGATARTILRVDEDPDRRDQRLLSVVANNLAPRAATLRFKIIDQDGFPKLDWEGESELTADDVAEALGDRGERDARADARAFLRDRLKDGEKKVTDIEAGADGAGVSRGTLRRAKRDLGITSSPRGPNEERYFVWVPPPGGFPDQK